MPAQVREQGLIVLGIGNTLLADDGVGVHVLQALRCRMGASNDIEFLDGGTLGLALAPIIVRCRGLIVLDAARFDATPGTTEVFCGEDMDRFLAGHRKRSAHAAGLADLMDTLQLENAVPRRRALIAVQPDRIDWGEELSPPVAAAVGAACRLAEMLIAAWRAGVGWNDRGVGFRRTAGNW
jgi:hydrogenase maturation protease